MEIIKKCTPRQKKLCNDEDCDTCFNRSVLSRYNGEILMKEFDEIKNQNININELSYSSHKKIWWLCENNHSYFISLNSRTNNKSGCSICYYKSTRKYTDEEKELCLTKRINIKSTTKIGDVNEKYVFDLLFKCKEVENISLIGHMGGYADIIIKLKNDVNRLLQVKTITHITNNKFFMTNNSIYPDNLLIVMVDTDKSHFAVEFYKNIKVKRLCLSFYYKDSKYKDIMTTNETDFCNKILKMSRNSTIFTSIEDQLTKDQRKEFFMIKRLQNYCKNHNLNYIQNETNSDVIDCYINHYPIQLKYATLNQKNRKTIQITVRKSSGNIGKKRLHVPYHLNDNFDYLIIELENFHNQFCIIPKIKLVEMKCISSDNQIGTGICYVAPPNYDKFHWTIEFWNKLDIF